MDNKATCIRFVLTDSRGVVEFVANCYDAEKSAMAGELKLPSWLTDKYKIPLPETQQPIEKVRYLFDCSRTMFEVFIVAEWVFILHEQVFA